MAGKSHIFLVKADVEDARTAQEQITDRKLFLRCFKRKHIIKSYGPSLIRQRSPEVPNLARMARGLGVTRKLFLTESLA